MSISIIIPFYNVEKYLEECLRSVMSQTFTDYECILVDDCGTDNSLKIAQKVISEYQGTSSFRIIHHERNRGVSAARNTGINAAKGDFLFFLDSDDTICPSLLEKAIKVAQKHPTADFVQCNFDVENGADYGQFKEGKYPEFSDNLSWIHNLLKNYGIPLTVTAKLIRRQLFIEKGLFFKEGIIREDTEWYLRMMGWIKSIAFCDTAYYWYRTGNDKSIMHNEDKTEQVLSCLEILKSIACNIQNNAQLRFISELAIFEMHGILLHKCKNEEFVVEELKKTIDFIKLKYKQNNKRKDLLLTSLQLLRLPFPIIHNRFFTKAYIEVSKLLYPI